MDQGVLRALADRRQAFWLGIEAVYRFDQMPDWHTLVNAGALTTQTPRVRVFISHVWQERNLPDPSNCQWRTLQKTFRSCFDNEPAMVDLGSGVDAVSPFMIPSFRRFAWACQALFHERRAVDPAILRIHHDLFRKEGQIGFWIDYCCLPQNPKIPEEEYYAKAMMSQVLYLASQSIVVCVWPDENTGLRRAWCLGEVAISITTGGAPVHATERTTSFDFGTPLHLPGEEPSPLPTPFDPLSEKGKRAVRNLISQVSAGAAEAEDLISWLLARGINCTLEADYRVVSNSMLAAAAPAHRISARAGLFHVLEKVVTLLWWILAAPAAPAVLLGAGMQRLMRFVFFSCAPVTGPLTRPGADESEPIRFGIALIFMALVIGPMVMVFGVMAVVAVVIPFVIFPVEIVRRFAAARLLSERSQFVSRKLASE